ncbi:MAG: PA0069 family radical SAM protein [Isosphaeraceae bacterium]|nr:PA0069 family radical SAM protein [Isosphaeraceae bacterium]
MNTPKGRGASGNPANRFERTHFEVDLDEAENDPDASLSPATQVFRDSTRAIIATNDSPDVGFDASINPYRGCEHGCVYCYARPTHEYLGFSAGLDFETKIMVKEDAPELLRRELASPRWVPKTVALSGVTDAYQPIERRLTLTRRCLEVLAEFRNPVAIVTKNRLVTRDADVLGAMAAYSGAAVFVSVTTLDSDLARRMEPRASTPPARLAAIEALRAAGVPVGVMVAPVIPGLNDHEIPAILQAAAKAGAQFASYTAIRLPLGVGPLFEAWLDRHYPERKAKVLYRIREIRGGRLNDSRFGDRMHGQGPFADLIEQLFATGMKRAGIEPRRLSLSTASFRKPGESQLRLFQ